MKSSLYILFSLALQQTSYSTSGRTLLRPSRRKPKTLLLLQCGRPSLNSKCDCRATTESPSSEISEHPSRRPQPSQSKLTSVPRALLRNLRRARSIRPRGPGDSARLVKQKSKVVTRFYNCTMQGAFPASEVMLLSSCMFNEHDTHLTRSSVQPHFA